MKNLLEKIYKTFLWHREWTLALPAAIGSLVGISWLCVLLQNYPAFPASLTEDVGMIVKYAIRGVGLVIAFAIAGFFKSWLAGDVDENETYWNKMAVDFITLCFFVLISVLAVFGSSLWL